MSAQKDAKTASKSLTMAGQMRACASGQWSDEDDMVLVPRAAAAGAGIVAKAQAPTAGSDVKAEGALALAAKGATGFKLGARSGQKVGLKPLKLVVPYSIQWNCAAGGVVSSVVSVLADSNTTEWNALVALYDEYRVEGGTVRYTCVYQTPAGANTSDACMSVLAWDPINGSALASVREGCEISQHRLVCAQATSQSATTSAALSLSFGHANGLPYLFNFKTSPLSGVALTSGSGTISSSPGAWKSANTAGSNNPDGYLKVYGTSDNANPVLCITGIVYLNVHFRSRR